MKIFDVFVVGSAFVWSALLTACGPQPVPKTPEVVAQEKARAEDEVVRMTRFLQLCNSADNGGVVKFEPQHTEYVGRTSRVVMPYIECKNGLGAFYKPNE